jgi:hypothetical protein
MADLFAEDTVSLQDMLGCARRELSMREKAYPGWVARGRMTQDKADVEMRYMAAIVRHFETLVAGRIDGSIQPRKPMLGTRNA